MIFDIGGVLEIIPETGWRERWARRVGIGSEDFDRRLAQIWPAGAVGAASLEEIEAQIGEALDVDGRVVAELMEDVWAEYVGTLNAELLEYFEGLRPRFKTGILSNSFVGAREREHQLYGFADRCDLIVYSHEVGCMKPDQEIYRIVCTRLDVEPRAAVLLDDVDANTAGAVACGMHAVLYRENQQAIAELDAMLG